MRRYVRRVLIGGIATLALAGCVGTTRPAHTPPPRAPVVIRGIPMQAAPYVAAASSIDLYEIKSSQMAQTRANDPRLRDFATMMVSAHQGLAAQLSLAGRRLNLLPSAQLQPGHQRMIDTLESTMDFDAAYRSQQIQVHEEALKLHSDFASRGESPTLRPVAANAAPIERAHLARLRAM
jgi:putative membrane protein